MLENFQWDIPVSATGAQATPQMRLILKPRDEKEKIAGKYLFHINKAAVADLGFTEDKYKVAFSFDNEGELIMAVNVPDTMPHYVFKAVGNNGLQLSNKRFAEKLMLHIGHTRMKVEPNGQVVMNMHWREETAEGDVRIFNLIRLK